VGDIRIVWDPTTGTGDLNMLGAGLELGHDLETASLISMFTDAQVDPGDIVFDNDPHGCWIDTYAALEDPTLAVIPDDHIGSKIYQAFARPRTQDTLNCRGIAYGIPLTGESPLARLGNDGFYRVPASNSGRARWSSLSHALKGWRTLGRVTLAGTTSTCC
jgi:hypothetical protein